MSRTNPETEAEFAQAAEMALTPLEREMLYEIEENGLMITCTQNNNGKRFNRITLRLIHRGFVQVISSKLSHVAEITEKGLMALRLV